MRNRSGKETLHRKMISSYCGSYDTPYQEIIVNLDFELEIRKQTCLAEQQELQGWADSMILKIVLCCGSSWSMRCHLLERVLNTDWNSIFIFKKKIFLNRGSQIELQKVNVLFFIAQ